MLTYQSPDAEARNQWLYRLELAGKVKGEVLTLNTQGSIDSCIDLLRDGKVSKKDIRAKDIRLPTGLTALHLAALFGDEELFKQLIGRNADVNVTCYCQITSHSVATKFWMDARPLLFAIGAKNTNIVEQLLKDTTVSMIDAWPLFSGEWWQLTGRFDWMQALAILKMLVQHKLDVNGRAAILKWTMLHYCVNMEPRNWLDAENFFRGRYETVDYLLESGADPLLKDTFGRTPCSLIRERSSTIPQRDLSDAQLQELRVVRADADDRLTQLLQKSMAQRLEKIRARTGFRGSLHKLVLRSQSIDHMPLLRSSASLFERSSVASIAARDDRSEMHAH